VSEAAYTGAVSTEAGGTQQTTEGTQTTAGTGDQGDKTTALTDAGKTGDEYAFDVKAPEGVELDQAGLDEFTKIVKDPSLKPGERAQKLVDLAAKREADRAEAFAKTVQGWADEVNADKELGNPENQAAARKIVETFGTPELKDLLNSTGIGNHPVLVRFVLNVSKAMSEDSIQRSRGDAPAAKDAASILYDNTPK
jgi:hypothetical protein